MSRYSAPIATAGFVLLLCAAAVPAQTNIPSQTPSEPQTLVSVSKVRIVRISEVRGTVQLDRSNGHNFEPAIANLPVIEKNRLKTATGIAEVEFEDNSSLRLGTDSEVQFVELGRTSSGATISTIRLVSGTAYVSLVKSSSKAPVNEFKMAIGDHMIQLQPDTHLRLHVNNLQASLAVLSGTVHLDSPNQVSPNEASSDSGIDVPHKKTVSFALIGDTKPTVASSIETNPLDAWDKQHDQFHSRVASLSAFGGSPYTYGLSDLGYYGSFADSGCGTMWRPYFTSAGWDPFSNGTWAYYSGAGYSWVSPYPWAWTPYHYGSWSFCPGTGWGWMPGGSWMGLNNTIASTNPVNGKSAPTLPIAPPHPPRTGEPSMVALNRNAIAPSGATSSGSFVFRNDSAGLGVPRGELGNLRGFSEHAGRSGQASTPVYYSAGSSTPNATRGLSNTIAPVAVHRGFAPPVGSEGFSSFGNVSGGASTRAPSSSMPVSSTGPAPSTGGAHR